MFDCITSARLGLDRICAALDGWAVVALDHPLAQDRLAARNVRATCYYQGMTIQWYLMNLPPGHKLPKWKRTFGVSDSGTVFLPAAIAGNEQAVLLCAGYDGVDRRVG